MSKDANNKEFVKNFIGKGAKVSEFDIVKVTICIDDAKPFFYEYEGKQYLSFEVAQMKQPDSYGKTHTCYVPKLAAVDDKKKEA